MRTAYLLEMAALLAIGAACAGGAVSPLRAQTPPAMPNPANPAASQGGQELRWGPAPDVFPAGAEMAVLQGDPSAAGEIFTVRMRMPDGYIIPAHWHPTDEHVTVLQGTLMVGLGDRYDPSRFVATLGPGGFITAKAHMNHYVMAHGPTVVQVHAMGPFEMTYVNPADDPRGH
jgi:quercetin dioxygenase-like cupin family protein